MEQSFLATKLGDMVDEALHGIPSLTRKSLYPYIEPSQIGREYDFPWDGLLD